MRRDGPEVLLDPGERLDRVDVADHRQDGVARRVVRAEERARVLQRGRVQVRHRADRGVVIGVAVRVGEGGEPLEGGAVGHVVVALAALVLHDVALVLHRLVVQGGQQGAHAVGLQPERELQLMGGHRLEVVGALEAGGAVERTARALHQLEVAVALHLGGTLEHQMLEEVSQTGAALDLVARADVVPEAHRRHRGQVVLGEHHPQTVRQAVLGRCQAPGACLGCGRVTHGHVRPFARGAVAAAVAGTTESCRSCHCMQACGAAAKFPEAVRRERDRPRRLQGCEGRGRAPGAAAGAWGGRCGGGAGGTAVRRPCGGGKGVARRRREAPDGTVRGPRRYGADPAAGTVRGQRGCPTRAVRDPRHSGSGPLTRRSGRPDAPPAGQVPVRVVSPAVHNGPQQIPFTLQHERAEGACPAG